MKRTNIFFLLLAAVLPLHAQKDSTTVHVDSIPLRDTAAVKEPLIDKITDSRLFQTTYVGVPLIVGGLIEKHQDKKFRTLRNDFLPEFKRPFDNYLQFLPPPSWSD